MNLLNDQLNRKAAPPRKNARERSGRNKSLSLNRLCGKHHHEAAAGHSRNTVAIAVYQLVIFYFGLTLHKRGKNQIENEREIVKRTNDLPEALNDGQRDFVEMPSVTENTTELFRQTSETERRRVTD